MKNNGVLYIALRHFPNLNDGIISDADKLEMCREWYEEFAIPAMKNYFKQNGESNELNTKSI